MFIAGLFVLAAREWAAIARLGGEDGEAARSGAAADEMAGRIGAHGWDGAWYRRAYDHFSRPIGSAACDEGQIFIEPQGLMAMAGVGLEDGRARLAAGAVRDRLATPHGIVLLQPAYRRYHLELGEISSYPPGYKENAGIFCHSNPWMMIAEAILGDGEQALDYYSRINPSVREAISDVHRCEPYVYAQMIAGRDAPTHGEDGHPPIYITENGCADAHRARRRRRGPRPRPDPLLRGAPRPAGARDRRRRRRARVLRLVAARQLRVAGGVRAAIRDRVGGLRR